ncbi:MAG: hypothetical protein EPN84_10500 [Legionella sp.]|nr:MAG: hypothetical protein EPN84_10500 [Legionella sp.]
MSTTAKLNETYGRFFVGCFDFAIAPYTVPYGLFASSNPHHHRDSSEIIFAGAFYAFFTFIVPILPALTAITIELAITAASLALLSAMFAYPIALVDDLVNSGPTYSSMSY